MNLEKGLVSVIMSNYNTPEEYLRASIESILEQTYRNFEFIIIDDCSTDDSLSIIESYDDSRIVIIRNEQNLGITKSLNKGLAVAKGEFIARMDADDVAFRNRFEKQVDFLKANPNFIVCGTGVEIIGDCESKHSNKFICRNIPERESFRIHLLFGNYPNIVHPTAMFNHGLLLKNNIRYNERYPLAQDYRMWVSCSEVAECANLPETLLFYRVHGKAVSTDRKELQKNITIQIMQEQLSKLNLNITDENSDIHIAFLLARKPYDIKYKKWIKTLLIQNKKYKVYNCKKLKDILWKKWAEISYFGLANQKNPIKLLKIIFDIPVIYLPQLIFIKKTRSNKK